MATQSRKLFICSCEGSMPLDAAAIGKVCRRGDIETADQLCRAEIERFRKAAAKGDAITVGCTQE